MTGSIEDLPGLRQGIEPIGGVGETGHTRS